VAPSPQAGEKRQATSPMPGSGDALPRIIMRCHEKAKMKKVVLPANGSAFV